MLGICIEQPSNHALVLRVVLLCLGFEEVDATLAQCDGDFNPIVPKHQILRPRQEVSDDLGVSEEFARVLYFRAHKFVCLSANSLHRICESHLHDR